MKFIITESKLEKIIDKIISEVIEHHFGELTLKINDDGYYSWFSNKWKRNIPHDTTPNRPLHKNHYGTLWIESEKFYEDLMDTLGMITSDDEKSEEIFMDWMNKNYDTNINGFGLE